ncbi:MAG: peptide MFS transporter, partial [Bacteroidota bacterium]
MSNQQHPMLETYWGHPKGLVYLFFAELWERFSFYGMRALLTLYMTKQLLYSDEMSIGVYATYGSLVYATPLIGGFVADQLIGYRKAIILGGILMAIGHFMLAIEDPIFFYGALSIIIVGNGFFKPNISSLLGTLYKKEDNRRDAGFTIFYLGINIGGMVAPLICAYLAEQYGWHYGFGLAGLGMLLGLVFFYRGLNQDIFGEKGKIAAPEKYQQKWAGIRRGDWVVILSFLAVPPVALLVRYHEYEHYLIGLVSVVILFVLIYIYSTVTKVEKSRLLAVVYFTVLATLFWAIFEQAGSSLTLFADRNVNLVFFNASQTNSFNSGFIILLCIPFFFLWPYLDRVQKNPNSAIKFGIGLILLGMGFVIFASSARQVDDFARTPMFYLVLGYFVLTIGEMFLSPIGLSKMTELSPKKYIAFIMGVWFLSSFYGHFFAGKIARLTATSNDGANALTSGFLGDLATSITGLSSAQALELSADFQQLFAYVSVYAIFGIISIGVGILALLFSPIIK